MNLFCHVKEGDKVLINTGEFSGTISVISKVIRMKCKKRGDFFKVLVKDLPMKTVRNKKTGATKQVQRLIHSSNIELLEAKKAK
jgi:ribosomal protein L24